MSNQQFVNWVVANADQFGIEFKEETEFYAVDEYRTYNESKGYWMTCNDSTCGGLVHTTIPGHYEPDGN